MSDRSSSKVLLGAAIAIGTAVLAGLFVYPVLVGLPHDFGLYRCRAEVWAAIGQWVTAGIAVAAAVFALNQVQEARRTRERQTQPNVVAFADLNSEHPGWLDLVVKNFGQTSAYCVRFHFEPWPTVIPWTDPRTGDAVTRLRVPDEIPVLAPGQAWRTLWDEGEARASAEFARETFEQARGYIHPLLRGLTSGGCGHALRGARGVRG